MADVIPAGTIIAFAGKSIPPGGWEICDGKEVSKTDPHYTNLFTAIGTTWGDAAANFKLPDLKDRFLYGAPSTNEVAVAGGTETHNHGGWTGNARGDDYGIKDGGANPPAATGFVSQHAIETSNHLPPFKKVLYLIKL